MHILIIRNRRFVDSIGVFAQWLVDGKEFCVGVENGDDLLPLGTYDLVPHDSPKHPDTVALVNHALGVYHQPTDVPPGVLVSSVRTDCLIHNANWPEELEGCNAPGESVARFPGRGWGVTRSIDTLNKLRELWGDRTGHTVEIREEFA